MDLRVFPGSVSQATLLTSSALTEMETFAQTAINQSLSDTLTPNGLMAWATSSTIQAQSVPNMTVKANPFAAFLASSSLHGIGFNSNLLNQTGASIAGDGLTATANLTISPSSPANPRRDLVCFQIQSLTMNYASNNTSTVSLKAINTADGTASTPTTFLPNTIQRVALQVVQGTAAASPALPSVPAGWTALAEVYVPTNATTITSANIFFALPYANRGFNLNRVTPFTESLYAYTEGSGLVAKVSAGNVRIGTTFYAITAASLTMTDSTTNYIFVDNTGTLTSNTTSFPSDCVQLAVVTTSGGNITNISDRRASLLQPVSTGSAQALPQGYAVGLSPLWASGVSISFSAGKWLHSDNLTVFSTASTTTISNTAIASAGTSGFLQSSNLTGTVTVSSGANTIVGVGTAFGTDIVVGDTVLINSEQHQISTITDATHATAQENFTGSAAAVAYRRGGPAKNTLFHSYLATNGTTTIVAFSTRDRSNGQTLVDLPSGYVTAGQLPLTWRLNSSAQYSRQVVSNWGRFPVIEYGYAMAYTSAEDIGGLIFNGAITTTSSSAGAIVNASQYMPSYSTLGQFYNTHTVSFAPYLSPEDDTTAYRAAEVANQAPNGTTGYAYVTCPTSTTQRLRFWATTTYTALLWIQGYRVTKEIY